MQWKSNNIEVMTYHNTNEFIKEIFESFLLKYQIGLETSMKGNDLVFDSVQLLYYKFHKVSFKRGGSYIDSPDWIKKSNNESEK